MRAAGTPRRKLHRLWTAGPVAFGWLTAASGAHGHHPMGGQAPMSLFEGLLSGLGHPLIEPGHALFLVGASFLVAMTKGPLRPGLVLLMLHVLASAVGTAVTLLPTLTGETLRWGLALSMLALVPGLWIGRLPAASGARAIAVATGIAQGLVFGEAVIGVEPSPRLAYLAGLAIMQGCMTISLCVAIRAGMLRAPRVTGLGARALAGSLVAGSVAIAAGGL